MFIPSFFLFFSFFFGRANSKLVQQALCGGETAQTSFWGWWESLNGASPADLRLGQPAVVLARYRERGYPFLFFSPLERVRGGGWGEGRQFLLFPARSPAARTGPREIDELHCGSPIDGWVTACTTPWHRAGRGVEGGRGVCVYGGGALQPAQCARKGEVQPGDQQMLMRGGPRPSPPPCPILDLTGQDGMGWHRASTMVLCT